MDFIEFKRILTTFADIPANVDATRGHLIAQLREDIIEGDLVAKQGSVFVVENDVEMVAEDWLVTRIARLPLLADRILSYIPEEPYFVAPSATLLDQLETSPEEHELSVDAVSAAMEVLDKRPAGTSSILYLTSDAGEGKTTLINHIARYKAAQYRKKETDWLLVPVSLAGRPFLRFDDVIIGALVNRLRFQLLYYEAFVELVRMGVIVLALDGFEEMFIERTSGDAVSAVGNLMQTLRSSGTVLIAARKAYFEYRSLETQSRLYDALGPGSVAFAKLALHRWDRSTFLSYCTKRGIADAEALYQEFTDKFSPGHPLLTRAVLINRLLRVVAATNDRGAVLRRLKAGAPEDYFNEFVNAIIEREVYEKWISKSGDPPQPLLTLHEHHELLSAVALEMWTSGTEHLSGDMLGIVAELFCDGRKKAIDVTRQVVERIKDHALIVKNEANKQQFNFDHEEFYHYFLGEAVGAMAFGGFAPDVRDVLRRGPLPELALDVAVHAMRRGGGKPGDLVGLLGAASGAEGPTSFARENSGGLIIRLLDKDGTTGITVEKVSFPSDALEKRDITGALFRKCYFQPTSLRKARLKQCHFEECDFERLELSYEAHLDGVTLANCRCASVTSYQGETVLFDQSIERALMGAGFAIQRAGKAVLEQGHVGEVDEELALAQRAVRVFLRATEVNESVFKLRLGTKGNDFLRDVLPELERAGILHQIDYEGGGKQRRFRLTARLDAISDALRQCHGSFQRFLALVGRKGESS